MKLWLDLETFSEADLKEVGTYRYADEARVLLFAYAIDEAPPTVWDCGAEAMPDELQYALQCADAIWAQNAQFDKAVLNAQGHAIGVPPLALPRWRCSMAMALSHALPASLAALCAVLKVPDDMSKLAEGTKLVQLFTRPQPANRKVRLATRDTHPGEWERFKAYAAHDIIAMRECVRRMPTWNWDGSAVAEWHCDQRINERGFHVDRELTRAGARAALVEKERIGVRFRQLTQGLVERPSQREQFKAFIQGRFGVTLENTTRDTFEQMMKSGEATGELKELMQLSIASNKTSTAKYAALDPAVQGDDRFRGGLQFAGAGRTRRWAGRLFQPQNLPSRGLPDAEAVEMYIEHLKAGSHDLFFDNLMLFGAAALRGIVVAPPGKKLLVADLANIEGRMLSWVAGENWKLDAFRAYDEGTGPDLYNVTASSILGGDPWKVSKKDRNVFGKVPDLASGYMGGVAGYQTFAHAYGVRLADYWDTIQRQIAPGLVAKAKENLESWGRASQESLEISDLEWIASETCKLAWRARHPATVRFWYDLQDAAKKAISDWGSIQTAGRYIKVRCVTHAGHKWMVVRLPSGRYLTYFDPRLVDNNITYMGESAEEGKTTRQWVRVYTHGGKMTGNCLTAETRVFTTTGLKAITQVRSGDLIWDGASWVATDGVLAQGRKAVGSWLGLGITRDHLIYDGASWMPVERVSASFATRALIWASSSAPVLATLSTPSAPWRDEGRSEPVFDLLNCGPHNRFTVLTDSGPVVVHNCCQTLARDILMPALQEAETRGYLPVLSVHDEAITEAPDTDEFSAQGLIEILSQNPKWADGLPLAAAGFEARRYKKD